MLTDMLNICEGREHSPCRRAPSRRKRRTTGLFMQESPSPGMQIWNNFVLDVVMIELKNFGLSFNGCNEYVLIPDLKLISQDALSVVGSASFSIIELCHNFFTFHIYSLPQDPIRINGFSSDNRLKGLGRAGADGCIIELTYRGRCNFRDLWRSKLAPSRSIVLFLIFYSSDYHFLTIFCSSVIVLEQVSCSGSIKDGYAIQPSTYVMTSGS